MTPALLALALMGQGDTAPMPKVELLTDTVTAAPGKPFRVAVHMELPDGWHNYYANPGESGMPTRIAWSLPKGWKAGPILWAAPSRIVIGGIPNYAYEGSTWFFTEITPATHAAPAKGLALKAKASWLLCREACVPQSADLSLSVNVGAKAQLGKNAAFDRAASALPRKAAVGLYTAKLAGKAVVIHVKLPLKDGGSVQFFPADPDSFSADKPTIQPGSGYFDVAAPLSKYATQPPKRISGVLVFSDGRHPLWIDGPIHS